MVILVTVLILVDENVFFPYLSLLYTFKYHNSYAYFVIKAI